MIIEGCLRMKIADVRAKAFAMPLNCPSYPPGPYRFYGRELMVIGYRTDPDLLRALVPEPLEVIGDIVKLEFAQSPDSTGFGVYTRCAQMVPVSFSGERGLYVHSMFLDVEAPIAGGREIWGFPQILASPRLFTQSETFVGTLHAGSRLCAVGTMGYKHNILEAAPVLSTLEEPNFLIKIIPHVDGTPRICELVRYRLQDVTLKGAWSGPAAVEFFADAIVDVARLPVREVLSGTHLIADLTLGLGEVVHDYLAQETSQAARPTGTMETVT